MAAPCWFAAVAAALAGVPPQSAPTVDVTLESLLREMLDRDALARWPQPEYVTKQQSSYDRRSKTPDDASDSGWFANVDNMDGHGADLKWIEHGERNECVLVDAEGPGALTRLWFAGKAPEGSIRFYIDGASEPVLSGLAKDLLSGAGTIPTPLAVKTAGDALNLYLPIPFARHLEITYDEGVPPNPPPQRWYNAEYRVYAVGTRVHSFAAGDLERVNAELRAIARQLASPDPTAGPPTTIGTTDALEPFAGGTSGELEPGGHFVLDFAEGPRAIRAFTLTLTPDEDDPSTNAARTLVALRHLIVAASFDGEPCIWCPASEFFGTGPRLVSVQTWTRVARDDGSMAARFTMPFAKTASIALENVGDHSANLSLAVEGGPWRWDDRSLHFHATWHGDAHLPTRPFCDWNYVAITGQGLYVGDALSVMNPTEAWWGEGDEKVFVDGEKFPSHFGTGSEDCYGYAWGAPVVFQSPFVAQPRVDGPGNLGHTTVTRTRALDAIPFTKSLSYNIEVWHWADCDMEYAAASYWYAKPGATSNRTPDPTTAKRDSREPGIAGAVECERMEIVATSPALAHSKQADLAFPSGRWSCDAQLFVQAEQNGDFVELRLAKALTASRRLRVHLTRSYDYGILRFFVNGRATSGDVDTWHETSDLGPLVELGTCAPKGGELVLRVEVVGSNPKSRGTGHYFGLDCVELLPPP